MTVRNLEPKALWNHFADLNAVPRASKKEERVIQFAMDFGKNLGLETMKDEVGNVIIKKPATKGMEDRPIIAVQSHLDMYTKKMPIPYSISIQKGSKWWWRMIG